MKIAIYVEGITEAGFVYQLIKEKYQNQWTEFRLECSNLDPKSAEKDLWDYGDENSENYFLIFDSCSDGSVSSDMLARFENHRKNGFDKVVGLRDVYSDRYTDLYEQSMLEEDVEAFKENMRAVLQEHDPDGYMQLRFAIMETEAWLLAVSDVFGRIDSKVDADWLLNKVGINVSNDPEKTVFHPFKKMKEIYASISRSYDKHWPEIKEIVFKLTWNDFDNLYHSGKCNSFKEFYDAIFL